MRPFVRTSGSLLLPVMLLAVPAPLAAQSAAGLVEIRMEIVRACMFSMEADTGAVLPAGSGGALARLHCSPGADYQIEIDGGLYRGANGLRHLGLTGEAPEIAAGRIAYRLFGDPAWRTPLPIGTLVSGAAPAAGPAALPIFARIDTPGAAGSGPWSDTLQVTVTW